MSQLTASWRVAMRVGRRDVLRSKGRSLLVVTMVGTPVLLTVMLTSIIASNEISPQEGLRDQIGSAQAVVSFSGGTVRQEPDGLESTSVGQDDSTPESTDEIRKSLERAVDGPVQVVERGFGATVVIDGKGYDSSSLGLDASRLATGGMYEVSDGMVPRAKDEVLVSHELADRGAAIGSTVEVNHGDVLRVVGIGQIGTVARGGETQAVLALPGVLTATESTAFLIDRSAPVTWDEVRRLNREGFVVTSRDVLDHPPATSELYDDMEDAGGNRDDAETRAVLAVVVTAIVIEVVLLAGPAFAVGVRRQRRDLALLAATGATPKQIRRVVLGQALVLGVLACFVGAGLGAALSALVVWLGPTIVPKLSFGPFEMQWLYIAAAILLGSLASMVAAFAPARQAAKQEVAAVLAGRRGTVRSSRGWPVVGVVLVIAGLILCFTLGTRQGGELAVAAASITIVLGTVFLTPGLIGLVSRVGWMMPLPLRLAIRDTARQRARSAPAIAAIMASVAGITTLAIGSASDFEQSSREYQYEQQLGRMTIHSEPEILDRAIAAASKASGGIAFTTIGRAGADGDTPDGQTYVYPTTSDTYSGSTEVVVANAATARQWGVRLDAADEAALSSGGAVVGDPDSIKDGKVVLEVEHGETTRKVTMDAVPGDLGTGTVPTGMEPSLGLVLVTPASMTSIDVPWETGQAISASDGKDLTKATAARVDRAVSGLDPVGGGAYLERGFQESYALPFLALLAFGALAVLIGTMTATGLALSDARPDFSTLAAVGAAPRTRRLVAGSQAVVLATLGSVLGIAVGFGPGVAVTWPLTSASYASGTESIGNPIISIPWVLLAVIAVAVPAIAALAAMLVTRSRLPVVRRLAQ